MTAIVTITAGAGGAEACDWAGMLLRMYQAWAQNQGYEVEPISSTPGEQGGLCNATIRVVGADAYEYLKAEAGVHRLVCLSPFDPSKRRHTSFALVEVQPEGLEQVRCYVLHPYTLAKDLRTGIETSDVQAVLDGALALLRDPCSREATSMPKPITCCGGSYFEDGAWTARYHLRKHRFTHADYCPFCGARLGVDEDGVPFAEYDVTRHYASPTGDDRAFAAFWRRLDRWIRAAFG